MSSSFDALQTSKALSEQDRLAILEDCMNQYGDEIKRLVFSYVKNHTDTDDLTQEVFVTVYQKIDQFKGDSSLKSWIYRIAINKCKDHLRSFKIKQRFIKEKLTQLWAEDYVPTPEVQSIKQENSDQLLNCVEELPFKYREMIILYYFEDLSIEEITNALDMNTNTVKARLRRARDRLKTKLETNGGDLIG
ncbi:sigma-70 family RNA polymerase sigma factor [Filobacillus milosensis]|uniref:RNA polymerase sigma factor n=1 Tax=Filobacillus milosensis TaxID=94137 RepID=A0A4Y8IPP6_9BACI|nr:sigma-70 family RNA polymerase sigma factor [Filobacillus milosensis]TFB21751.1 sigma-70 family RNA polymerase sigma factor [Filobacillus milosensis]